MPFAGPTWRRAERLAPDVEVVAERERPRDRRLHVDHAVGRVAVQPVEARSVGRDADERRNRALLAVHEHRQVRVVVELELLTPEALDPVDRLAVQLRGRRGQHRSGAAAARRRRARRSRTAGGQGDRADADDDDGGDGGDPPPRGGALGLATPDDRVRLRAGSPSRGRLPGAVLASDDAPAPVFPDLGMVFAPPALRFLATAVERTRQPGGSRHHAQRSLSKPRSGHLNVLGTQNRSIYGYSCQEGLPRCDAGAVPGGTFDETGIIRIPGAFSARDAARMRDVVWNELRGRYGIRRDDPSTWQPAPADRPEVDQAQPRLRRRSAARPSPPTLDAVLGAGTWRPPKHYGNVLVTMPDATEWRVPHRLWHPDFPPTLPAGPGHRREALGPVRRRGAGRRRHAPARRLAPCVRALPRVHG